MKFSSILIYICIMLMYPILLLQCSPVKAEILVERKETRVAIIDTGVNESKISAKICGNTHFTTVSTEDKTDYNGHGTEVANVIAKSVNSDVKFCIIPYKIFDRNKKSIESAILKSIQSAIEQKADIINLSLIQDYFSTKESEVFKKALDLGIIIVAAAGNNSKNLDKKCNVYPVCYDNRILVVGFEDKRSNFGKVVDYIFNGNAIDSYTYDKFGNKVLQSGSSFAAPRLVATILNDRQVKGVKNAK